MFELKTLKVAIIHDWLISYRGGEKVLESICELYPEAPIYTLFYDKKKLPKSLTSKNIIYPKRLNSFRLIRKFLLPLLPQFIEEFDLTGYDLIISSSSCVAKGIIPDPSAKHICYIHSPMRYIWDQRGFYFSSLSKLPVLNFLLSFFLKNLRLWDTTSSHRVDLFLSNSSFVQKRVKRYYRRDSEVLFPSPNMDKIKISLTDNSLSKESYFLVLGALVPYKNFKLAIETFNEINKTLWVVGEGPESKGLKKLAKTNIIFKGHLPSHELYKSLAGAKALIFPGTEDFGLTAVESFALGTPVIAHKSGGALDFIEEEKNGIFFKEKTTKSLLEAITRYEKLEFNKEIVKKTSLKFSKENFQNSFRNSIEKLMKES